MGIVGNDIFVVGIGSAIDLIGATWLLEVERLETRSTQSQGQWKCGKTYGGYIVDHNVEHFGVLIPWLCANVGVTGEYVVGTVLGVVGRAVLEFQHDEVKCAERSALKDLFKLIVSFIPFTGASMAVTVHLQNCSCFLFQWNTSFSYVWSVLLTFFFLRSRCLFACAGPHYGRQCTNVPLFRLLWREYVHSDKGVMKLLPGIYQKPI